MSRGSSWDTSSGPRARLLETLRDMAALRGMEHSWTPYESPAFEMSGTNVMIEILYARLPG